MRRRLLTAMAGSGGLLALGGLSACASAFITPEPRQLSDVPSDSVLVVGRIELVPKLRAGEQDLSDASVLMEKDPYLNRFILTPGAQKIRDPKASWSGDHLNPLVGQTFALSMSKAKPFIVFGRLYMDMRTQNGAPNYTELRLPAPIDLGILPSDTAIYVGTWRIWRDEFHSVTRLEVIDQQASAAADLRQRFGRDVVLRKSLARFARS